MTERGVAGSWPSVAVVVPNHSRIDERIVEALDGRLFGPLEPVSYTHLTLPTTPYE